MTRRPSAHRWGYGSLCAIDDAALGVFILNGLATVAPNERSEVEQGQS